MICDHPDYKLVSDELALVFWDQFSPVFQSKFPTQIVFVVFYNLWWSKFSTEKIICVFLFIARFDYYCKPCKCFSLSRKFIRRWFFQSWKLKNHTIDKISLCLSSCWNIFFEKKTKHIRWSDYEYTRYVLSNFYCGSRSILSIATQIIPAHLRTNMFISILSEMAAK